MKLILKDVLSGTPKFATAAALSAMLVACGGGGTSGDATTAGDTGVTDAGGATDNGATTDFGNLDLDNGIADAGGTDSSSDSGVTDTGTTDVGPGTGFTESGEPDADNDGVSDEDELDICKGRGGEDPGSIDADWSNNCHLEYTIGSDPDVIIQSPFFNSLYVKGAQRVLYCREHGGDATSTEDFADGKFGLDTLNALFSFQEAEGLVVDGEIGPATWGQMQMLVEDTAAFIETISAPDGTSYDLFGVVPVDIADATLGIDCSAERNFAARIGEDLLVEGWELTATPGSTELTAFSISMPAE